VIRASRGGSTCLGHVKQRSAYACCSVTTCWRVIDAVASLIFFLRFVPCTLASDLPCHLGVTLTFGCFGSVRSFTAVYLDVYLCYRIVSRATFALSLAFGLFSVFTRRLLPVSRMSLDFPFLLSPLFILLSAIVT